MFCMLNKQYERDSDNILQSFNIVLLSVKYQSYGRIAVRQFEVSCSSCRKQKHPPINTD